MKMKWVGVAWLATMLLPFPSARQARADSPSNNSRQALSFPTETVNSSNLSKKDSRSTEGFISKKDQRLQDKVPTSAATRETWEKLLRKRLGKRPTAMMNILNTWTNETLAVEIHPRQYRGGWRGTKRRLDGLRLHNRDKDRGDGAPSEEARNASWYLRCHFTNKTTAMDPRLFAVLIEAAHHFQAHRIEIISGFRAPKYNLMLRKKGHQVARNSHHTKGEAVDFRIPGIPISRLRRWATRLKLGGVGYYAASRFVHVDIGRVRTWRGE